MHLAHYLGLLHRAQVGLAGAFREVAESCWTVVGQAAQGVRDHGLLEVVQACEKETATQLKWLRGRMKQAAPQALVVA